MLEDSLFKKGMMVKNYSTVVIPALNCIYFKESPNKKFKIEGCWWDGVDIDFLDIQILT